jgi:hypothetical protein
MVERMLIYYSLEVFCILYAIMASYSKVGFPQLMIPISVDP